MKQLLTLLFISISVLHIGAQGYFEGVKRDVEKYNNAIVNEDYTEYIEYLNPSVLERAGGKEVMIQVEKDKAAANASVGFKTLSITPVTMSPVVNAGAEMHTILTQEEVIQVADSKFKRRAYYLAATSDGGKSWTFVGLEPYTKEGIKLYIPNYNDALDFPSAEPAEVIKE